MNSNAAKTTLQALDQDIDSGDYDAHFRVFHELMGHKIFEILLVSGAYDAFIMEQDGSLSDRILNEYRGLNLSRPPRMTRVATPREALQALAQKPYDLVISLPHVGDMDVFALGDEIKISYPHLPVILLSHSLRDIPTTQEKADCPGIDSFFLWTGDSDFLWALVKNVEDSLNVEQDTRLAKVRVLILVEDSPLYRSYFLPIVYKEVITQTQAVIEESLNEEHRLLQMRARPRILLAETFEEAQDLYRRYRPYIFGVICDTRFPRQCELDPEAGFALLAQIKHEIPHLPLLLHSSESHNRKRALELGVEFVDKNSPHLRDEIHAFFLNYLGFGDFIFRRPDGTELGRADNLKALEELLPQMPEEPIYYEARRNRFSNWIMARSEIGLASRLDRLEVTDFSDIKEIRQYLITSIHALRHWRQKGVVVQFNPHDFDPDIFDFLKIGRGSLGGKARSLAFIAKLLHQNKALNRKYPGIRVWIPKTLVITTEGFESYVVENGLEHLSRGEYPDPTIVTHFLEGRMPVGIEKELAAFLSQVSYPLAVRSSSLLEDAHFQPYAGLHRSYLLSNNDKDAGARLAHLIRAVKLVYASAYFEAPRRYYRNTAHQLLKDSMAVIVQQAAGQCWGGHYYPAISGVVQSHNYYPIAPMQTEDGIVRISLGMGKSLNADNRSLRFCPRYPNKLPGFSTVDEILANAPRTFYALKMTPSPSPLGSEKECNLIEREMTDAHEEFPVRTLSSTYLAADHRLRPGVAHKGPKVVTFHSVLRTDAFPLPQLMTDLAEVGHKGFGGPVEVEFAVNLNPNDPATGEVFCLQMRPMNRDQNWLESRIEDTDIRRAFAFSRQALGHGRRQQMEDIVYVRPDAFDASETVRIAAEISRINSSLVNEGRSYLLVGPGRWGSADRWLGIPVRWQDISGVGAMVELRNAKLKVDPSQGTHFFQNITSRGIAYITLTEGTADYFDWLWIDALPAVQTTEHLRHIRLANPFVLKIDGHSGRCVITADG